MSALSRIAAALAAFLLLTSPGFAPISARSVAPAVDAKPALWQVSDGDTTIWLFGTVHVLRPDVRWFGGTVKGAFDDADTLVLEVLTPDRAEVAQMTAKLALDPDGPPLSQKLDPALRTRYRAILARYGLAEAGLEPFHPWFAALTLSVAPLEKLGYRADLGTEEVLKAEADKSGKTVVALENVEEQLGFFSKLPEPTQIAFLAATVNDAEKAESEMARMVGNWARGRPDALADNMNDSLKAMPEVADALLYRRNKRWATWIAQRLNKPGKVFIAVGAGHLAGKGSVLDELAKAGLKVRRVE